MSNSLILHAPALPSKIGCPTHLHIRSPHQQLEVIQHIVCQLLLNDCQTLGQALDLWRHA
jgi:hypothetical protein